MILNIKDVKKLYNGHLILDNINIQVKNISSIGIIGESGCGKSTLLRQLAGIEDPDEGDISVNALSPITQKKEFQKQIGYVFQKHNLFPHLTIEDNIKLILEKINMVDKKSAQDITDKVLKQMFILEQAKKKPHQVSGGQAQRASIARALATSPKLIFLDEPTAALDPILTAEVLNAVKILKKQGIEFIFVTHEMEFLKDFADYIIFMDKGIVVEHGTVDILNYPNTPQLKRFLSYEKVRA